jgi:hypothetical protein
MAAVIAGDHRIVNIVKDLSPPSMINSTASSPSTANL